MWFILLLVNIICLLYLNSRKPKNFPPGPAWLPIIGCGLELNRLRQKTGSMSKASGMLAERYGPVVGARIGVDRVVFVCGAKEYREFSFREEFNGRPRGVFYTSRTWGKRRRVLFTDGEFWEEQRAFIMKHLREFGMGKRTMSDIIEGECQAMVSDIGRKIDDCKGECVLRMDNMFGVYVLNTLWTMMSAKKHSPDDMKVIHLQNVITDLISNIHMDGALFSHFPILRYICPGFSGFNSFVNVHRQTLEFLRGEIEECKEGFDSADHRSLTDAYLDTLQSPGTKTSFSEEQLLAISLDLFIAGTETSAKSLAFAFLYLILNPDIQAKAQEEIDAVIGRHRLPTMKDRPRLKYAECVVLESIRKFAGQVLSIPRNPRGHAPQRILHTEGHNYHWKSTRRRNGRELDKPGSLPARALH
ncbi:probable cytochrome P450 303a1 [Photinus pyralis]|uniref:probable cytochrome P450 303a1 n=1 Tax=Photinus pyralis TaxID=7054 RepID=UPI00126703E9|nr:probable cytochrome P450 303a1 [Photinus pyralis]